MGYVRLNLVYKLAKCIHKKMNATDFQSKHKRKYTLNVDIY